MAKERWRFKLLLTIRAASTDLAGGQRNAQARIQLAAAAAAAALHYSVRYECIQCCLLLGAPFFGHVSHLAVDQKAQASNNSSTKQSKRKSPGDYANYSRF